MADGQLDMAIPVPISEMVLERFSCDETKCGIVLPMHIYIPPKIPFYVLGFCLSVSVHYSLVLVFFIQAEPYIGITPGCAASESGVTSPELLIMFPYSCVPNKHIVPNKSIGWQIAHI